MHGVGEGVKATLSNQAHLAVGEAARWSAHPVSHVTNEVIRQSSGVKGTFASEKVVARKAAEAMAAAKKGLKEKPRKQKEGLFATVNGLNY